MKRKHTTHPDWTRVFLYVMIHKPTKRIKIDVTNSDPADVELKGEYEIVRSMSVPDLWVREITLFASGNLRNVVLTSWDKKSVCPMYLFVQRETQDPYLADQVVDEVCSRINEWITLYSKYYPTNVDPEKEWPDLNQSS